MRYTEATDVGITPTETRIAVVADVETPLAPGLFKGSPDAVNAFAKYINAHGGLAGRKVVVDFIDSHLNADEARNAIITACSEDFALVGTAALFLNNVDDMTTCVDKSGAATGIPDLPIVITEVAQQCSPVSFPVNAPQLLCSTKDDDPQTFRVARGTVRYYRRTISKDLQASSSTPTTSRARPRRGSCSRAGHRLRGSRPTARRACRDGQRSPRSRRSSSR